MQKVEKPLVDINSMLSPENAQNVLPCGPHVQVGCTMTLDSVDDPTGMFGTQLHVLVHSLYLHTAENHWFIMPVLS